MGHTDDFVEPYDDDDTLATLDDPLATLDEDPNEDDLDTNLDTDDVELDLDPELTRVVESVSHDLRRETALKEGDRRLMYSGVQVSDGELIPEIAIELVKYALAVIESWIHSGQIFGLCKRQGRVYLIPSDEQLAQLRSDRELRESLSNHTVHRAYKKFTADLKNGTGWRHDGGAKLTTYFLGGCLWAFRAEWAEHSRSATRAQKSAQAKIDSEMAAHRITLRQRGSWPPGEKVEVEEFVSALPLDEQKVINLRMKGYTQKEIVKMGHATSERTLQRMVAKWKRLYGKEDGGEKC